jgi:hypothetical protein
MLVWPRAEFIFVLLHSIAPPWTDAFGSEVQHGEILKDLSVSGLAKPVRFAGRIVSSTSNSASSSVPTIPSILNYSRFDESQIIVLYSVNYLL